MTKEISRRTFLKRERRRRSDSLLLEHYRCRRTTIQKENAKVAASDKLNILGVGIGGRGAANLAQMETENIIGLCDVDWKYADHVFRSTPGEEVQRLPGNVR